MFGVRKPVGIAFALGVILIATVISGCATSSEVTDEPPGYVYSAGDQVSQIGQGGTARISLPLSLKPECLNPYLPVCSGSETLNGVVFEGLLTAGSSGEYKPVLARTIPSYSDGTLSLEPSTIEVRIRQDATFSDGEPVTAEDVKWTYEQAAGLADAGEISVPYAGFRHVEEVRAEGETVTIELDGPYSEWRELLAAPVIPQHVYGARGNDLATTTLISDPVGSGPFRLDEFGTDETSFTANPRYWTDDELRFPRLDGLEVVYLNSSESGASLAGGGSDFGLFAAGSGPDSGSLLYDAGMKSRGEVLLFNSAALGESERASLSASLDRRAVAEAAGLQPSRSLFGMYGDYEVEAWTSDNSSTRLTGMELRLVYPVGGPARDRAVERIVAGFEDAGADVDVRRLSAEDFYGDALPTGDFDLAVFDVGTLASYEALEPFMPERSASAVASSLKEVEEPGTSLSRTQRVISDEDALVPLYVWTDSYAWSSALSGPRSNTPARSVLWNVRDWGFFE